MVKSDDSHRTYNSGESDNYGDSDCFCISGESADCGKSGHFSDNGESGEFGDSGDSGVSNECVVSGNSSDYGDSGYPGAFVDFAELADSRKDCCKSVNSLDSGEFDDCGEYAYAYDCIIV